MTNPPVLQAQDVIAAVQDGVQTVILDVKTYKYASFQGIRVAVGQNPFPAFLGGKSWHELRLWCKAICQAKRWMKTV